MKKIVTLLSLTLTPLSLLSIPSAIAQTFTAQTSIAQTETLPTANRCTATTPAELLRLTAAKNEARQTAEVTNGGIGLYRAEPAMHGSVVNAPCEVVSPGVGRFSFRGGDPVAVSSANTYRLLTVVTVSGEVGRDRTINIEYNGPIAGYRPATDRSTASSSTVSSPTSQTAAPIDIPVENTPALTAEDRATTQGQRRPRRLQSRKSHAWLCDRSPL